MITESELKEIYEYVDYLLDEGKRTTLTRTSRNTKIKRAMGQLSSVLARQKNDPLYKKMLRHRELYFQYKTMIHRKYGSRVRSKARR